MSIASRTRSGSPQAVLTLVLGLTGLSMPAASEPQSQSQTSRAKAVAEGGGRVVDMTAEQLLRYYPEELGILKFSPDQGGLDSLLLKMGERVDAYFLNFPNTTSKESVLLERMKANGKVEASLRQDFDYLVIAAPDQGRTGFEEDRRERKDRRSKPPKLTGYCLTSGYTGIPILFQTRRQSGCSFRYLGRQPSAPRAHVIAFAQRPESGNAIGSFRTNPEYKSTPLLYQGLIWVDPVTYQITRLRVELLAPMPEIGLSGHTTEISFGEVHFESLSQAFWLPQKVMVTIRWKGKTYRNLHRYSEFRLFTVKSFDKIEQPQVKGP